MKTSKKLILTLALFYISSLSWSQELPQIFKNTIKKIEEAKIYATFPEKTFLENLLLLPDGSLLVNSHFEGVVYKVDNNGNSSPFASVNGKVTGIATYGKDKFVLTGNDENDKAVVFVLNSKGTIEKLMDVPEGIFLNGITRFKKDDFLVADSYKGCIWKVNVKNKTVVNWLEDDLLKRNSDKNSTPAANGIKFFKNKVYVSNTQKQILLQIGIENDTPIRPEIYTKGVNIDDFIFDNKGNIFATTHVYNSVIKITPNKIISIIAEQPQGVSGSTACILQNVKSGMKLYVSTNGGMYLPPSTGIEKSKIVVLNIN